MHCKITCLGGGSRYFVRALPDLLMTDELAGSEIVLYDLNRPRADHMASAAERLADEAGTNMRITVAASLAEAVDSADFAVSSIGGSGAEATQGVHESPVHLMDRFIPAKYGIYQIIGDTCGPAGMMMGLRSAPAYLEICREMEKRCPDVLFLNHSNPMAVLCRVMHKYTGIHAVGICHGVQEGVAHAAELLGVPPEELDCLWVGTNHYYWFTQVRHRRTDVYPELRRRLQEHPGHGAEISAHLSRIHGFNIVYAEDNHILEFYPFLSHLNDCTSSSPYSIVRRLIAQKGDYSPDAPRSKAKIEGRSPDDVDAEYGQSLAGMRFPEGRKRTFAGENIGAVLGAIATGRRHVFPANIPNQGAIPDLPPDAEVEVEAVTHYSGVRPLHMGACPRVLKGMLEKRFVWQDLVADAAVKGDRNLALQALLVDEMCTWPEKAEAMLDELLEASRAYLPQFST